MARPKSETTEKQDNQEQIQSKPAKKEKEPIYKVFKKFRFIKEKDGKLRREDKPVKTCKMLQSHADELNIHKNNTLIEYVEE